MEEEPLTPTPTLVQALASAIGAWFPELQGRSIAVSEVEPFKDKTNVPTLPIAVVALVSEEGAQAPSGGNITLISDVLVQFIMEPVKYQRADGAELPFFAYYDYEKIRDTVLNRLRQFRTPNNGAITYRSLDVESDEFAVYIAIRLRASERWCGAIDESETGPFDVRIDFNLLKPAACIPLPVGCVEVDPCDFARERNPSGDNTVEGN